MKEHEAGRGWSEKCGNVGGREMVNTCKIPILYSIISPIILTGLEDPLSEAWPGWGSIKAELTSEYWSTAVRQHSRELRGR